MRNEIKLFIKLLDDDLINFNGIILKYANKLDLIDSDIFVLSCLQRQEMKKDTLFNSNYLKKKISLSEDKMFESLDRLTQKGYIEIRTETNSDTGKTREVFSLEKLYKKIVGIYIGEVEDTGKSLTFQEEISNYYEEIFDKQISPLDMDIIIRWNEEGKFSIEQIKNEMLNSAKLGKTSLKSVDQALFKRLVMKEQSPEYKEANKVIEELKEKWKK